MQFIEKECNPHQKLQAALAISAPSDIIQSLLKDLEDQQNSDGGFPGRGSWDWIKKRKNASATAETAESLYLLAKYNIESNIINKAINFLVEHQRKDGGWAENSELGRHIPDSVSWISSDRSVPWMTGVVAKALLHAKYSEWDVDLTKSFFLKTQDNCGTWPYIVGEQSSVEEFAGIHSIVEALLLMDIPKSHSVIQKALAAVVKARSMWEENLLYASTALRLYWLLEYEISHPNVRNLIEYILSRQRLDGAWGENKPHPEGTAQFVQLLGDWGIYYKG